MSGWPRQVVLPGDPEFRQDVIGPSDLYGGALGATGSHATGSVAPGAINLTRFIPVIVQRQATAYKMAVANGTVVAGNTHVGIYTYSGTRLVTASAAMTGGSVMQEFDIADTVLDPGHYFLALGVTTTTQAYVMLNSINGAVARCMGCYFDTALMAATATFSLPSGTATSFTPCVWAYLDSGL
jgi:hypothetical protein